MEENKWKKGVSVNFCEPQDMGNRPWGKELLLCHAEGKFIMKKLVIKAGSKGGFQYHRLKEEAAVLISGRMIVRYDDGNGGVAERVVNPGDCVHFEPGVVHQEEALEECILIEASTPVFNDRVRMEKEYGLGNPTGMPTTELKDIETK